MEMEMENKKLTESGLNLLLKSIEENDATADDYQLLEDTLNTMGINNLFLLNEFRNHNFDTFQDFINYRKREKKFRDSDRESKLLGTIRGVIRFIKLKI